MNWFKFFRLKTNKIKKNTEGVVVYIKLSDDEFGSNEERDEILKLGNMIEESVVAEKAGEYDGNEFGEGQGALYFYGNDRDRLFEIIASSLEKIKFIGAVKIEKLETLNP
ncbi:MAG: hypothetical protein A2Y12_12920 [Planctomycetes bacterium GWF2_42_9]|nr:MAG: hypothetical protein A2Y12_12920 [Planctomycetes bacterium GWF2_42_9]